MAHLWPGEALHLHQPGDDRGVHGDGRLRDGCAGQQMAQAEATAGSSLGADQAGAQVQVKVQSMAFTPVTEGPARSLPASTSVWDSMTPVKPQPMVQSTTLGLISMSMPWLAWTRFRSCKDGAQAQEGGGGGAQSA